MPFNCLFIFQRKAFFLLLPFQCSIMIATQTYHVNLALRIKILYLSTALHETFAMLAMVGAGRDAFFHVDIKGKVLFQYKFQHPVDSFAMPTRHEAIVLHPRNDKIYCFDLIQHRTEQYSHQFLREQADLSQVYAFSTTGFLCVREIGLYQDNRLHLTYYQHPMRNNSLPIAHFHSKDNQWTYDMSVYKANTHSLFAWCRQKHDEEIDVRTFDLSVNPSGQFRHFRLKNTLGFSYNLHRVEILVQKVFELRPHELCLKCFSSKNQAAVNKDGIVNNNFVLNTESQVSPYICQSRFYFQGNWNNYLIDCLSLGSYAIFYTCLFEAGNALLSPVFYISNQQEILCRDTWKCTYLTKFYVPGFSNHTLMESEYENGYVSEFTIHERKLLNPTAPLKQRLKEMYDFDDTLLQDVYDLLEEADQYTI